MWRDGLGPAGTLEERVARAFAAWAQYVRTHPYAPRLYFRETTGDPDIAALHAALAEGGNLSLAAILGDLAPAGDPLALVMASEVIRGGLTELAIWWTRHADVPTEAIVATAMNTVWVGMDRVLSGEVWSP